MDWIIGFLTGLGSVIGIFTIIKVNKKLGILQLLLTIICPILTYLFCLKKDNLVFGGTDFEYLIQTTTVDRMAEPLFILILYIILIVLISINIFKLFDIKNKKIIK